MNYSSRVGTGSDAGKRVEPLKALLNDIVKKVSAEDGQSPTLRVERDAQAKPPTSRLSLWGGEDKNPIYGVEDSDLKALQRLGHVSIEFFSEDEWRCTLTRQGLAAVDNSTEVVEVPEPQSKLYRAYLVAGVVVAVAAVAGLVVQLVGSESTLPPLTSSTEVPVGPVTSLSTTWVGTSVGETTKSQDASPDGPTGFSQVPTSLSSSEGSASSLTPAPTPKVSSQPEKVTSPKLPESSDDLSRPERLQSTKQTRDRVVLKWGLVKHASKYVIERWNSGQYELVGESDNNWHTDRGLNAGTSYRYRVIAVSTSGSKSAPSEPIEVATNP